MSSAVPCTWRSTTPTSSWTADPRCYSRASIDERAARVPQMYACAWGGGCCRLSLLRQHPTRAPLLHSPVRLSLTVYTDPVPDKQPQKLMRATNERRVRAEATTDLYDDSCVYSRRTWTRRAWLMRPGAVSASLTLRCFTRSSQRSCGCSSSGARRRPKRLTTST